jgi:hypothetical protein
MGLELLLHAVSPFKYPINPRNQNRPPASVAKMFLSILSRR